MENTKSSQSLKSALVQLEDTLVIYFVKKAPFTLPNNIKELIVNFIAPWGTVIGTVFSAIGLLSLLGMSASLLPLSYLGGSFQYGAWALIADAVLIVTLILEALAIKGLFNKEKKAWDLLFYVSLLNAVYPLVRLDLIGLLVGAAISWYFLFQVREYYK